MSKIINKTTTTKSFLFTMGILLLSSVSYGSPKATIQTSVVPTCHQMANTAVLNAIKITEDAAQYECNSSQVLLTNVQITIIPKSGQDCGSVIAKSEYLCQ